MRTRSILAASAIALLAAPTLSGCAQNRTLGEGIDDVGADLNLKRQLLFDRDITTADVDLAVFEGRLLLAGTVPNQESYDGLLARARRVGSVREVIDEVRIGAKTTRGRGARDALIDQKLGAAMLTDNGVYSQNYQVVVSQGTVYLLGVAQGPNELRRVTDHAATIDGVTNVVSHVVFVGDPRRQTQR